jgi:hypothetical protein
MRFRTTVIIVTAFAIAMAYLESAVVVYLQRALSMTPDTLFPLRGQQVVGDLAAIEVGREAATLVMLATIGCLVGRRWADRLAWTAVAFGVWDLFYYVWLWVLIGWPHSPGTWDVLFLIPVPWAGPVWAPAAVSAALIGFGLAAAYSVRAGRIPRVGLVRGAGAVVGGLLVVASFTANTPALIGGGLPGWYPWPLFVAGIAVSSWSTVASLRVGSTGPTEAAAPDATSRALSRGLERNA